MAQLSGVAYEFERRVRDAFAGTPYQVTSTDQGFDVRIDVADATWYGILNKAGLKYAVDHRVTVGDGWFRVLDVEKRVEWVAGIPRIAGSAEVVKGRVIRSGFEKTWAFNERGEFTRVVDYTFHSEEGRRVVTDIGKHLGLRYRMSGYAKLGLVFALIGGVGALISAVVLILAFSLGWFD
ncbi:hypothetical protein [Nocardioides limicola]|uniref:hypothetical protein n=1 Tax=Nocardioides limicola TaxID=2803368 RepID=UPI00193B10A5|nr:hypothetical protein [Nocardioides sp. DJM-14]